MERKRRKRTGKERTTLTVCHCVFSDDDRHEK